LGICKIIGARLSHSFGDGLVYTKKNKMVREMKRMKRMDRMEMVLLVVSLALTLAIVVKNGK
jgi:hypothetical protein